MNEEEFQQTSNRVMRILNAQGIECCEGGMRLDQQPTSGIQAALRVSRRRTGAYRDFLSLRYPGRKKSDLHIQLGLDHWPGT
jgi:hypothetical protein